MSNIMQLCALVCSAILIVGVQAAEEVELPSSLKNPCDHKLSDDYSSCLREAIEDKWPILVKGVSELGLPKLDPLEIDLYQDEFQLGTTKSRFIVRNVKAQGLANTIFRAIRANRTADRMSLEVDFSVPKFFAEGYYQASNIMGPFKNGGKGYFNVTSEGASTTWTLDGRIENDRWVLEHVRSSPDVIKIDKLNVYFDDLFNGNKELNKAALSFINEYWRVLFYTMPPVLYDIFDARWTEFLNQQVFSKLSFAKTFP